MKKSMKISKPQLFVVLSLILVLAIPVFSVSAKDKVVSGSDFNLQSGETLDGNLVVFGGNVTVNKDALVDGDVAVFGGNIVIDGMIDGDFVALGGSIKLGANAVIDGDFSSLGGSVDKSPTAEITGDTVRQSGKILKDIDLFGNNKLMNRNDNSSRSDNRGRNDNRGFFGAFFGAMASIVVFFATILIISGLGLLVSLLLDNHLKGISQTFIEQPLNALGIGLLAIIATIAVIIVMSITVIFIPVAIILAVALGLLMFYGWIVCGYETGQRLTKAMKVNWSNMWVTAFGTFVITLVSMGLSKIIPCVGWIPGAALTLFGLGGVIIYYYRKNQKSSGSAGTPLFPKNSDIPSGDYSPKEGNIQQSSKDDLKDSNGETAADSDHAGQEITPTVVEMPAKSDSTQQQETPVTTDEIIPESTPLETHDSENESTAGEDQKPEDANGKTPERNSRGFSASILDSIKSDLEDDEKKPE